MFNNQEYGSSNGNNNFQILDEFEHLDIAPTDMSRQNIVPEGFNVQENVNVLITYDNKPHREFCPNTPVQISPSGGLNLTELINNLKRDGFPFDDSIIFYYGIKNNCFVYCGKDPLDNNFFIPAYDVCNEENGQRTVSLKIRQPEYTCMNNMSTGVPPIPANDEYHDNYSQGSMSQDPQNYQTSHGRTEAPKQFGPPPVPQYDYVEQMFDYIPGGGYIEPQKLSEEQIQNVMYPSEFKIPSLDRLPSGALFEHIKLAEEDEEDITSSHHSEIQLKQEDGYMTGEEVKYNGNTGGGQFFGNHNNNIASNNNNNIGIINHSQFPGRNFNINANGGNGGGNFNNGGGGGGMNGILNPISYNQTNYNNQSGLIEHERSLTQSSPGAHHSTQSGPDQSLSFTNNSPKKVRTRHSERTIGDVVDIVATWRRHCGVGTASVKGKTKSQKVSLDDAAKMVGVARKSLNDYLLMIRQGTAYGFDFDKHSQAGFGTLRSFVNKQKKKEKEGQVVKKGPDIIKQEEGLGSSPEVGMSVTKKINKFL